MVTAQTRLEKDCLGSIQISKECMYGIQTQRAIENYPYTGIPISFFPEFIKALASIKKACSLANISLDVLDQDKGVAISKACDEIMAGKYASEFIVDVIQGGAGTSTNMNVNEVIANRALELSGYEKGHYEYIHPNNHVNLSQSTNDVYPTAVKLTVIKLTETLKIRMMEFINALRRKAFEFKDIITIGRTQLQDAVPMTMGIVFNSYAEMVQEDISRLGESQSLMREVNLGGTAIGTGINAPDSFSKVAVQHLNQITRERMCSAVDLVEATQDTGVFVQFSGVLKRLAVKLSKICNDLRLLSSGPRCGLNEILLPEMAPGSSIMPGKVNPVIPESVNQIAYQVIGSDTVVTMAAEAGQLQLNAMEPIIAYNLFSSINLLGKGYQNLYKRCIEGLRANKKRCEEYANITLGLATALTPFVGYEAAAELAKKAQIRGCSIFTIAKEECGIEDEQLKKILAPLNMVRC